MLIKKSLKNTVEKIRLPTSDYFSNALGKIRIFIYDIN